MQTIHCKSLQTVGVALCLSLMLAACGGGGDAETNASSNASNATNTGAASSPADTSTPTPSATPAVPVASNSSFASCSQIKSPQEALNAVNAARAVGRNCGATFYPAAPALQWNDQLANAALAHSKDMATRNYFDHTNLNGESPFDRTEKAGYGRFTGENIAAGYATLDAVMKGWLSSEGHCKNIMRQNYKDFALACAVPAAGSGATYNIYWTQNFGAK